MKTKLELTETIGNKAANLVVLESMIKDYAESLSQLKTLTVAVPQICPLAARWPSQIHTAGRHPSLI